MYSVRKSAYEYESYICHMRDTCHAFPNTCAMMRSTTIPSANLTGGRHTDTQPL